MADPVPFADRLRALREAAGLTQRQLALAAGLHEQYVSRLERGERANPSLAALRALARALGASLDALGG